MSSRASPAVAPRRGRRGSGATSEELRLKAAEHEARRREADFRNLAENIPDVIMRLDRARRCVYANPAVEPALGVRPERLIGRAREELALPHHILEALFEAVERTFETGAEQPFGFQAGDEPARRHFSGRVIPERDANGRIEAALAITYDVTARAIEDERRARLLERERNARADAESAALARDQFLAIVSHELRSPLNGIKSWTHVLQNQLRNAEPTVKRALAGIMIGVDQQVRLIEDLLDVTRALSGNFGLVKQAMALEPVLLEAVEAQRAAALEKGLRLTTDFALGDRQVLGDHDRLRQILVNLLTNAIKFTGRGGTIRVAARIEGGMACIEVADNGAGITPDFLPHVFDPFRQADQKSSRRSQEGLGLGLALVQRLAKLHGGYATCESSGPARGSTFRVYLPLHGDAARRPPAEQKVEPTIPAAPPALTGVRVLLIDDQREARESLAALLGQAGARVTAAASGQEALAHLALADEEEQPHVVVCDIAMPGEDGYTTLRRIRAWDASRGRRAEERPAVAISAFAQREDRQRALDEGFQAHLTKPVAPAELMGAISGMAQGLRGHTAMTIPGGPS
ncbi:MAG TPA: ATP-binding protein [Usitatibacter sp.]|nr:ATP-binding protein [Usitatibacter sp.]